MQVHLRKENFKIESLQEFFHVLNGELKKRYLFRSTAVEAVSVLVMKKTTRIEKNGNLFATAPCFDDETTPPVPSREL